MIILVVLSMTCCIALLRIAFSEAPSRYPAPRLGRIAVVALAVGSASIALSAIGTGLVDSWTNRWALRLLLGLSGIIVSVMAATVGLYALALAPNAYARQHPDHPSVTGAKATADLGRVSGVLLLLLAVVALPVTAFVVADPP